MVQAYNPGKQFTSEEWEEPDVAISSPSGLNPSRFYHFPVDTDWDQVLIQSPKPNYST